MALPSELARTQIYLTTQQQQQLSALASTRAVLVLPVPRGPLNKYAWLCRPSATAVCNAVVTCCCPLISAKFRDRYRRYRD